jgi:hypothetical protein
MAAKPLPDQDYLRQCFAYEADTGVLIWAERPPEHFFDTRSHRSWTTRFAGKVAGVVTNHPKSHIIVAIYGKKYLAHRLIWKMLTNEEPPEVDHWDGNELNNRQSNLRAADRGKNARNTKKHADNPRMKGVYRNKKGWCSKIMRDGVIYRLGTYSTEEEAHAAYCEAAQKLHGEFANFGEDRHSIRP